MEEEQVTNGEAFCQLPLNIQLSLKMSSFFHARRLLLPPWKIRRVEEVKELVIETEMRDEETVKRKWAVYF